MNTITVAGHLGGDAEVRYTSTGKKVTSFRLAARTRKGQNDDTIWWRVTVWGDQYDKMVPYLKKGSGVIVTGEVQKPEIFNDREGKPQISLDVTAFHIQFSPFGRPASAQGQTGGYQAAGAQAPHSSPYAAGQSSSDYGSSERAPFGAMAPAGDSKGEGMTFDDEVPF